MVLINNNWEMVRDLEDVSKIIRENFNSDLADEMDKLIPKHSDSAYEALENELEDKNEEIVKLENKVSDLDSYIEELENQIDELKKIQ